MNESTTIDSQTAILRISIWFFVAIAILAIAMRFAAQSNRGRCGLSNLRIDDWITAVAAVSLRRDQFHY